MKGDLVPARASMSFSAVEIEFLCELVKAVCAGSIDGIRTCSRTPEFAGFAQKTHAMKRKLEGVEAGRKTEMAKRKARFQEQTAEVIRLAHERPSGSTRAGLARSIATKVELDPWVIERILKDALPGNSVRMSAAEQALIADFLQERAASGGRAKVFTADRLAMKHGIGVQRACDLCRYALVKQRLKRNSEMAEAAE